MSDRAFAKAVARFAALTFAVALPVGALVAVSPAQGAGAATVDVTNCNDSGPGSLRNAVTGAISGETIGFAFSPTCTLITETTGPITVGTNLTIDGPGASTLAVSGATAGLGGVFVIGSVTATISGLTINDGGQNASACDGGGIANSGTLTVTDSTLSDNIAQGCGGGGIYNSGALTVTDSTLSANSSGASGGAIYNNGGTVTVTGSTLSDNTTGGGGGGIYNASGPVTLTGSTVSGNSGAAGGGGIYNASGMVTLTGSTMSGNTTDGAGGGIDNGDTLIINDSTLSGNSATGGGGGGISNGINAGGTTNVTDSTLSGNRAGGYGGGILNDNFVVGNVVNVTDSTLSGNATAIGGGGIFNGVGGTSNVADSTLSGNSATTAGYGGGGIGNDGTLAVTHATLSGNSAATAGTGGGIWNIVGATDTMVASIVANNGLGLDCFGQGTLTGAYNLDDDGSCAFSGTSLSDTPAGLDPAGLQNNGGPTQTIALETGSPAINYVTPAADCTGNDQRGVAWPTPCDIGAVGAPLLPTTTTTSLSGGGQSGTSIMVPAGTAVSDTATLSGMNASTAMGTVTYRVYSDSGCTTAVSTGPAESITTPGTLPASSSVTLSTPGTYYWQASYSGDSTNASSASPCGATSEVETVTAAPRPPGPPLGATAVAGNGQATVSWTAPQFNGNSPITAYRVTASSGGQTCSTAGALSCVVSGLANGTAYTFTVTATNTKGTGPPSAPSGWTTPAPSVVVPGFTRVPGAATAISEGADGAVWVAGTPAVGGGHPLYRWNGGGWTGEPGGAVAVAVGPNGLPWVVNSAHQIFQWTGTAWHLQPGAATAMSEGADGAVWVAGTPAVGGGHPLYRWNGGGWTGEPGGAVAVAVGPNGLPWVVNSAHQIFQWTGTAWHLQPGAATAISEGADGAVWVAGTPAVGGGHPLYCWNGGGWTGEPGGAVAVAVGPNGLPWVTNSADQIYKA